MAYINENQVMSTDLHFVDMDDFIQQEYNATEEKALSGYALKFLGNAYDNEMLISTEDIANGSTGAKYVFTKDCFFYHNRGGGLAFVLGVLAGTVLYASAIRGGLSTQYEKRTYEFVGSVTLEQTTIYGCKYYRDVIVEYEITENVASEPVIKIRDVADNYDPESTQAMSGKAISEVIGDINNVLATLVNVE